MKTTIAIFAVLALFGCGADPDRPEPDFYTELGIGIRVEDGAAEWTQAPDLGERVDAIAHAMESYTSSPSGIFDGLVIRFSADFVTCGDSDDHDFGCTWSDWIDIAAPEEIWFEGNNFPSHLQCVERSSLAHELLHFACPSCLHSYDPICRDEPGDERCLLFANLPALEQAMLEEHDDCK